MPKSMKKRSYKKRRASRKNIKRVKITSKHIAHKRHLGRHYIKGRHKTHRKRYGGNTHDKCGCVKKMKGGMVSSPAAGPVGFSWNGGDLATWPGAAASQGTNTNGVTMSNHFSVSPNGIVVGGLDPARSTKDDLPMNGGRRRKNKQKGGFFQEIVNLGRGLQYEVQGVGYGISGKNQPISQNPFPTEGQPIDNDVKFIGSGVPNIRGAYVNANNQVAGV